MRPLYIKFYVRGKESKDEYSLFFSLKKIKTQWKQYKFIEINLTKLELETAYSHFENVVDPDLISSSIYHINSIQERYKYLLKLLKSIEEETKQKDRLSANQSS